MSKEGDSPRRDLHSVHCIAEILRRFDVIAIQEVKSNIRALRDTLKILGDEWSMILTDVNQGSAGNGERMAYLFDTRRVNLSGLAGELVVPDEWRSGVSKNVMQEQFVRSPYAVSFRSKHQTFILVTLHVLYGTKASDRVKELKGIAQCGIDAHVEGIAGGSGVAWIIFDVERREESQRIELLLRCLLIVEGKAFSFDVGDGTAPQARAQRNLLPREEIGVAFTLELPSEWTILVVANHYVGVSHVPWTARVGCTIRIRLHTQVHISRLAHSVRLKSGGGCRVKIVAIVAHQ